MNGYNNNNYNNYNYNNNYNRGKFINPYFTQNQPSSDNKNNNPKKKILLAIIISAVILVAFIVFFIFLINRGSGDKDTNTNNEETEKINYVGTKDYGYVIVPNDWVKYTDAVQNNSFQYSDPTKQYIVTLNAYQTDQVGAYSYAATVYNGLKNEGVIEDLSAAKTTVGQYEAYQVYGYYRQYKKDLIVWVFEDGQGKTHYLSLEGGDDIEKYLSIIDTFALSK